MVNLENDWFGLNLTFNDDFRYISTILYMYYNLLICHEFFVVQIPFQESGNCQMLSSSIDNWFNYFDKTIINSSYILTMVERNVICDVTTITRL